LRFGAESELPSFKDFTFRDIDFIHCDGENEAFGGGPSSWSGMYNYCITMEPAQGALQTNFLFEDIRANWEGENGFIQVRPVTNLSWSNPPDGRIDGVVFRNVSVAGTKGPGACRIVVYGSAPDHDVKNVKFENVSLFGKCVDGSSISTTGYVNTGSDFVSYGDITVAGYTSNIQFTCDSSTHITTPGYKDNDFAGSGNRFSRMLYFAKGINAKSLAVYDLSGHCLLHLDKDVSDAALVHINQLGHSMHIVRIVDSQNVVHSCQCPPCFNSQKIAARTTLSFAIRRN
jgi:hypothetical protein